MWPLLRALPLLGLAVAEDGLAGWLRYAPLADRSTIPQSLPSNLVALSSAEDSPVFTAGVEIRAGFRSILGQTLDSNPDSTERSSTVIVGTLDQYVESFGNTTTVPSLGEEGFWLNIEGDAVQIIGQDERGALYGAFEYLSRLARGDFAPTSYSSSPRQPIRWVNQWDNMDETAHLGSVERGYGGPSIFFDNGFIVPNLTRASQYARLLSSIGINGVIVNNVNANVTLFRDVNIDGLGRIAEAFRPYGVQLGLSVNFAAPVNFGNLETNDPFDPSVIAFWENITTKIYDRIPDMAGYSLKANTEGQPGPLTYNRTLADGGNMLARALSPHGGNLIYRAFVYDSNGLNWTNWKDDRANAAVDFFGDHDGEFEENVIVQIKYGPIDFQVREPVSLLFSRLKNTNVGIELQVTQEYLGQQTHLVYLASMWKETLDFDLRVDGEESRVGDIISGDRFGRPLGGSAAVVNVGTNTTWLGSHLAMSNLYAYGRMAWDYTIDPQAVLEDWIRLTFGNDPAVLDVITKMSMESWRAYENYSGNLGIQTLTDILNTHFGPNPASQDHNRWGQWTRAGADTIGMDRTVSNGTGNSGQYPPEIAAMYESIETTPDDLLLWFHHVPYTHELKSGKTVIQHFYDAHYEGAATVQAWLPLWESLEGRIDQQRYEAILFRLRYQMGHSLVWRDSINKFYFNKSGIADSAGRVGNYTYRIEAEDMTLRGYAPVAVTPFEAASGAHAIVTTSATVAGTASVRSTFPDGTYDLAINYFDQTVGRARYEVLINNATVGRWTGNLEDQFYHEPFTSLDGLSATRVTFPGVGIQAGDEIRVVGRPDGKEMAPLDYISVLPQWVVD
ncbi:hypothetical protein LZ554_008828 [Drepanopeziza brunnea f. sp. 'monogermtubi']|nr:hypothetical protein LZ554_008828 [Drepanopeziza brunnea f. sp. 'monogermtubi']